jgi:hypothetical protein
LKRKTLLQLVAVPAHAHLAVLVHALALDLVHALAHVLALNLLE